MNRIKKLIVGFLVSAMVLGMAITAYAASGTITISNANAGQTYDAYRVFDYVPADEADAGAGGIYKLASKFSGLPSYTYSDDGNSVAMSSFFTVGDNDILDTSGLATEEDVKVFGRAVLAYVKANGIGNDGSTTATEDGVATISVSEYGYYVVDSSLGSAVSVDTTTPSASIAEKNSVPEIKKEVSGATNSSTIYSDKTGNDAQIGDTVEFKVSADLKRGGKDYAIVDTLTPGLTLVDLQDSNISFSNSSLGYTIDNAYVDENGNKGFKITFEGEPKDDTTATVVYQAVVNKDAAIASEENINEAFLIYGNGTETTHVTTKTMTYPLQIKKIALGDTTGKVLPGAEFKVYRELDKTQLKFTKVSDTEYKVDPDGSVEAIVTVAEAPLTITGLNAENYILEETKAPQGYNLLESNVGDYKHAQQVTVSTSSNTGAVQVATVEDGTGLTLPSTGGIGTTIFYIIGGILVVAGIAYFIVRRKADAE
ncbi:SpaH/EbpB family LPXTG-anchored major pilin [Butyrivibrio sp. M55]|uniref:SpaH/EbpB family LPXTG-anchored major pilin n=1 Tax=Butyrivibrio sp. M55 TaxID=1855323 RepID=UPI0008F007D6|nr:SpaH/EbpB family LPXTG-anchored major pilin [Butyrivibrio sp. M55]SFU47841.1 LPXTG-motif cell wall anchor domain-containing protein/fimbrial isopeptide formation D2 domain-containing protein [Butyrivibrio sp. M55]